MRKTTAFAVVCAAAALIAANSAQSQNDRYPAHKSYGKKCVVDSIEGFDSMAHVFMCEGDATQPESAFMGKADRPRITSGCLKHFDTDKVNFYTRIFVSGYMLPASDLVEVGYRFDSRERFYDEWLFVTQEMQSGAQTLDLATVRNFFDGLQSSSLLTYKVKGKAERIQITPSIKNSVLDLLRRCFEFHAENKEIASIMYDIDLEDSKS